MAFEKSIREGLTQIGCKLQILGMHMLENIKLTLCGVFLETWTRPSKTNKKFGFSTSKSFRIRWFYLNLPDFEKKFYRPKAKKISRPDFSKTARWMILRKIGFEEGSICYRLVYIAAKACEIF